MKKVLIIAFLQVCLSGFAQDRQFSQFSASPLNLNPALTGNNACDWRVGLNLRNEWLSVNNSFLLGSMYGDVAVGKIKHRRTNFGGLGVLVNFDNAGQLNYQTTDLLVSAAYHIVLGRKRQ
jgi:type IX secretion system PorP/SprF family membrane protein